MPVSEMSDQLRAVRARIDAARDNLTAAVENTLFDLGRVGQAAAGQILDEIAGELDDIGELLGDPDE
jgi:hypothetical protein